ncbi:Glycosyltransferase [Rhynchospora pubera]|uniref:Glycosyltransferase n=1 Tax=Rhynchospora pubera TaxID=906938 RepID=A0AAV8GM72_9POAL|nr:Glycosyltransferase [Rhynchospora pubera]
MASSAETQPAHEAMRAHVVLFASPGMGHLIPMTELARMLASPHLNLAITIITKAQTLSYSESHKESFCSSLPSSVNVVFLPTTDPCGHSFTQIFLSALSSLPALRETIRSLKSSTKVVALITDFLSVDTIDVARELDLPFFVFGPLNLMALSFLLHSPAIDRETTMEFCDMPVIKFPGWPTEIHGIDLGAAYKDRKSESCRIALHMANQILKADGILCNSFYELEPGLASILKDKDPNHPPVYTIGPLVRSIPNQQVDSSGCIDWLNHQPNDSVLFVSFGSEGTLSSEQITELAWGLELSQQHFLWVIRCPNGSSGTKLLPEGFVERNKGGLVVQSWVSQTEILEHKSTGGFLTHCGWNSALESIMNGVPMIAWPLFAEQGINAKMLVNGIGVALRPEVQYGSIVRRDVIATVVKELMQGKGGRDAQKKALELKAAGGKALSEHGSSLKDLSEWKKSVVI